MPIAKDGVRSIVRVGYDRKVYKTFRGTDADKRYANEILVLKTLEARGCNFVPRVLGQEDETLTLITSNCGKPVEQMSPEKMASLFRELEEDYGVVHDDPFLRNVTYHPQMGRFCIIDFELAQILDEPEEEVGLRVSWTGCSVSGSRKPRNEDNLAVFSSEGGWARPLGQEEGAMSIVSEGVVLAVSDGMGGVNGGDVASQLVVNDLRCFLPARMGDFRRSAQPLEMLEAAVKDLNLHVVRVGKSKPECNGMGATLVCGLFSGHQMHFAHVGDSRIYRFREGELKQLSFDHSMVGRQFRDGRINERQARTHPKRNVLNRVIGADSADVFPQVGTEILLPGDWFLFCSDGVIDGLWDKNITAAFAGAETNASSSADVAETLIQQAVAAAGTDDTTLFVVQVEAEAAAPSS